MLPAKGYLKSIDCPFFETCICERPYCHYKHNKQAAAFNKNTDLISEIVSKAVHKVLQETGGGGGGGGANKNVTYNPTPISQLNKYNSQIHKKHIPIQYTPEQPRSIRKIQPFIAATTTTTTTAINNYSNNDVALNYSNAFLNHSNNEDIETDSDEESTLEQCKRIFEEYKITPLAKTTSIEKSNVPHEENAPKKRIAYESPQNIKKETPIKATIPNPALVMAQRYPNPLKRSPTTDNNNNNNNNNNDDNNNECPIKTKRIASVPNVTALLNEKKSIELMIKRANNNNYCRRTAHVPEVRDIPTVRQADKSKLPVNIRSRYLFLIVNECVNLYLSREAAYERALNEEFKCYNKCSAINSYRNTIMLLINRLRKEANGTLCSILIKPTKHDFDEPKLYEHFHKWILTDDQLFENGFPRFSGALKKGHALFKNSKVLEKVPLNCQQCARCKKMFQINEKGYPAFSEDCIYHPYNRILIKGEAKYSCCQQTSLRKGCCICSTHVFEVSPEKLTGFVSTFAPDPDKPNDPRSRKIYALDCEMVYTTRGFELARCTVIDSKCNVCYESLVKPLGDILDCNTRFSGLTVNALESVQTKITDVQATLLLMFNSETILVGHSFESDLKALRLIHNCVIDTSVLFPHKMGPQKKRALRNLASDYLRKIIQNDEGGHDSAEDAITCIELLVWKLKEELKTK